LGNGSRNPGEPEIRRAMRGDAEAIRALWELHRRWIAAVLLAHKPGFEDLDDLLQEVAVTFVAKINTLREETNLRAWLRTIAVNAARAAGRRGRLRSGGERYDDERHHDNGSHCFSGTTGRNGAAETISREHETRRMLERVARLPEAYREPLLLRAVQGMRSRQIADTLGIAPATVDTRIARARRMLREPLDADQIADPIDDGAATTTLGLRRGREV
jgi:RNA polymerase sigma-70 factor (ECF subfamily)